MDTLVLGLHYYQAYISSIKVKVTLVASYVLVSGFTLVLGLELCWYRFAGVTSCC